MDILLMMVVAAMLDPVRLIVVVAVIALWRSPWAIVGATVAAAVVGETALTMLQLPRVWGQGLVFGVIASLVQALVVYGLFKAWRARRAKA